MTYQEIKDWFSDKEIKRKFVLAVCFVLVFFVGFGSGKFYGLGKKNALEKDKQNNYNINLTKSQVAPAGQKASTSTQQIKGVSTTDCTKIKGNINSKGAKIYHMPGGAAYKITKAEQCFETEDQARAAGFVKSGR